MFAVAYHAAKRCQHIAACLFMAIILVPGLCFSADEIKTNSLYQKLEAASVEVLVDGRMAGTGWFASPGGVVVTAAHLVQGNSSIRLRTTGFGQLPARLIALDLDRDIAVLHVDRAERPYPYLQVAGKQPVAGQRLYLFGTPLFRHGVMVSGEVASSRLHYEWNRHNGCYTEVMYISAQTAEGFSGGAWVDPGGRVVAMQSGMVVWREGLIGIAFASLTKDVKRLFAERKNAMTVSLGSMFAEPWEQPAGLDSRNGYEDEGLLVLQTVAGGPLEAAGVNKGDALLTLDGRSFMLRDDLLSYLRKVEAWTKIKAKIRRKSGKLDTVELTLTPREFF